MRDHIMNCLEIEEHLLDYVDNELSGTMQQVVAEHLQTCLSCRKEVESYRKTAVLLQLRAVPEPPEGYWNEAWEKIRNGFTARVLPLGENTLASPSRWLWLQRVSWRPLVGLAAMFLLIIAAVLWSRQSRPRDFAAEAPNRIYLHEAPRPAIWRDDNLSDDMSRQIELMTVSRVAFGSIDPISKSVTLVRMEANNR